MISSLDPEVKLAIRFSMDKNSSTGTTITSSDDDQEVDEFVSSHGFEFIDGDNESRARVLDSDDDSVGEIFPRIHSPPIPSHPSRPLGSFTLSRNTN